MSDHIDRAAKLIDPVAFSTDWASAPDPRAAAEGGWLKGLARNAAQALDAAGLLVTPEHDAAVAARALRDAAPRFRHDRPSASVWAEMLDLADRIEREAGESDADA